MPREEVLRARDRFVAWLRWYMAMYPREAATPAELARKLGITKGALHQLMARDSTRTPSLETLLAAEKVTGMPLGTLLHGDPPDLPR